MSGLQPDPWPPPGLDDPLLQALAHLLAQAGAQVEKLKQGALETRRKADRTLSTRADRELDELLRHELPELLPGAWLSEESVDAPQRLSARRLWVVDPLDGTREFVAGRPEYSIAVAYVEDGRPSIAAVHAPASGRTFLARRGAGARDAQGRPLRVVESQRLLGSRSEHERGEFAPFEHDWELACLGSIQLKLALVAAGEAAVTLSRGPKHEWDVCAGALLVAEAGGCVGDLDGHELRFNQPRPKVRGVLAGAPAAYGRALEVVRRLGPSPRMRELDTAR